MGLNLGAVTKREKEEVDTPMEAASAARDADPVQPMPGSTSGSNSVAPEKSAVEIPPHEVEVMNLLRSRSASSADPSTMPGENSQRPDMSQAQPQGAQSEPEQSKPEDDPEEAWLAHATKEDLKNIAAAEAAGPEQLKATKELIRARIMNDQNPGQGSGPQAGTLNTKDIQDAMDRQRPPRDHGQGAQFGLADIVAAPLIAGIKVADYGIRKSAGLAKDAAGAIKTMTPVAAAKFQERVFNSRVKAFDRNLRGLESDGVTLSKDVEDFNLAFLNSSKTAAIRSYAAAKGIPFQQALSNIKDGTADPSLLAMARDALSDPKVVEASTRIDQTLDSIASKSRTLSKIEERISASALSEKFDVDEKSRKAEDVRKKVLDGVPDQVVKDPEDEELKERLKKAMEAFIEMIMSMMAKVRAVLTR